MKPDIVLRLGGISFERFEVPASISFGGDQAVNVHELIGGTRIVDVMGASEADKSWNGIFQGANAEARARALDALRISGQTIQLSWSEFHYDVVVVSFKAEYERRYLIPYSITCLVIQASNAAKPKGEIDVDTMIKGDAAAAQSRGSALGISTLTGALDAVVGAVRRVDAFVTATAAEIASVVGPVVAAQQQVETLIAAIEGLRDETLWTVIETGSPLGRIADAAEGLSAEVANVAQETELRSIGSILQRMETNLDAVGSAGAIVTQAGGDLYRLATDHYGDATAWVDIARANDLVDPVLEGVHELRVPSIGRDADGVL